VDCFTGGADTHQQTQRNRADRHQNDVDRGDRRYRDMQRQDQQRMTRHRGTVDDLRFMQRQLDGRRHTLARVTFENGKTVVLDLGPRMTEERFPVDLDEKATFVGTTRQSSLDDRSRQILVTH
jgi:hypothetical protein